MNNHRKLNKKCPDCDKEIDDRSTRCKPCTWKYKYPFPHHRKLNKHCIDCGKEIIDCSTHCKSCAQMGKKSHNYKHGLGDIFISTRHHRRDHVIGYAQWMKDVFERDEFKCQHCNSNKKLNAHHIYSYIKYPELRLNIDNGITLCEYHHQLLHQLFGKDVTPKQLKWFFENVK